jgi:hypothetical protein
LSAKQFATLEKDQKDLMTKHQKVVVQVTVEVTVAVTVEELQDAG